MDSFRRARAVVRDEGRLRSALADHEKRRFDIDSALIVRYRVEDLLETVRAVASDDEFWNRLIDIERPPSHMQLERVNEIDTLAFAALLEAAGYRSPPPPTADVLVDDTIEALVAAATVTDTASAVKRVDSARFYLRTLVERVRRQIIEEQAPEISPNVLRSSARSLGRAARWLIPRVVAGAAGAIVEAHAPGTGAGVLVGSSVKRVAEDLSEYVADMVIGNPVPSPQGVMAIGLSESKWTEIDPLAVHIAALSDLLTSLYVHPHPLEIMHALTSESRRHLDRLEELASDKGYDSELASRRILVIRRLLDRLPYIDGGPDKEVVSEAFRAAIDATNELRKELSH
jgi:hypothetical protein